MEARERTSVKWKGVRDRYYYDPMNHQRFRSKKEVSNMASSSHPISIQASHDLLLTSNIEPVVTGDVGFELSTIPPETSKTPKRCPTVKIAEERPEWLPEGWTMEARERTSMKWKGVRDRYYYDPVNHQRFRSKKEVERFLKMETVKKYETKSLEVEPTTDNLQSTLRLDLKNPPTMVSWVLSNFAEGVWTPYINSEEVSESTRNSWVTAMEGINNSANQFQE
ncbi:hypothetical protein MRB53_032531 [Persea americana]|uniref:Uncharacterized protein n=1 Tax=Persea americana TaxID=3435 RepID=A0ACC2KS59_PERAE|nr:hypothetical protein MRB53_032531 [Persea americana]